MVSSVSLPTDHGTLFISAPSPDIAAFPLVPLPLIPPSVTPPILPPLYSFLPASAHRTIRQRTCLERRIVGGVCVAIKPYPSICQSINSYVSLLCSRRPAPLMATQFPISPDTDLQSPTLRLFFLWAHSMPTPEPPYIAGNF